MTPPSVKAATRAVMPTAMAKRACVTASDVVWCACSCLLQGYGAQTSQQPAASAYGAQTGYGQQAAATGYSGYGAQQQAAATGYGAQAAATGYGAQAATGYGQQAATGYGTQAAYGQQAAATGYGQPAAGAAAGYDYSAQQQAGYAGQKRDAYSAGSYGEDDYSKRQRWG